MTASQDNLQILNAPNCVAARREREERGELVTISPANVCRAGGRAFPPLAPSSLPLWRRCDSDPGEKIHAVAHRRAHMLRRQPDKPAHRRSRSFALHRVTRLHRGTTQTVDGDRRCNGISASSAVTGNVKPCSSVCCSAAQ